MFVIEEMRLVSSGRFVSDGFYAGIHKKYNDVFNVVPEPSLAYGFETEEAAQQMADRYNRRGYNFVVRNRNERQQEIDARRNRPGNSGL